MYNIYHEDCLVGMSKIADKSIDLVLTDPPYGINVAQNGTVGGGSFRGQTTSFPCSDWDNKIPTKEYFNEIKRISKNQIIWGGNYFINYLENTRCMLVWYKRAGLPVRTFADCEIAWTSFDRNSMVFNCRWDGFIRDSKEVKLAHPTQKALLLFQWCIKEFSNEGDTVLDPFAGSGTTGIACQNLKRNFIGFEIDKEYYQIAEKRLIENEDKIKNSLFSEVA